MRSNRRNLRQRPLQVESLETLTLLSGLATPTITLAPVVVSAASTTNLAFNASAKGTFFTTQSNPDTGKDYHVVAVGRTTGGAVMAVGGELFTPGFVATGHTTGSLTVYTARGTL